MMIRTMTALLAMASISACSEPQTAAPAQQAPVGTPEASNNTVLGRFSGTVDITRGTLTIEAPASLPTAGPHPEGTLTYGSGIAGEAFLHTDSTSVHYDNGSGSGPCGATVGTYRLCGNVRVSSTYGNALSNVVAVIDSVSTGVTVASAPLSYGTMSAGSVSSPAVSSYTNWVFYLPSSANFSFTGHIEAHYWTTTGSMTFAPQDFAATVMSSGKVLAASGNDSTAGNTVPLKANIYDPTAGTWSSTTTYYPHWYGTVTLMTSAGQSWSGRVLVAGGNDANYTYQQAEYFDPSSSTWTVAGPTTGAGSMLARSFHQAVWMPSVSKVLVMGGSDSNGSSTSAQLYDPSTNSWSSAASMSYGRGTFFTAAWLPTVSMVLVMGASNNQIAEVYDPSANTWTPTGNMTTTLKRANNAVTLSSGKVLLTGGLDGSNSSTANTEIFDPSSGYNSTTRTYGTWSAVASMNTAREFTAATLLSNGQVLVAGGYNRPSNQSLASAEIYNPTANTWTVTASMASKHQEYVLLTLPSGQALAIAGSNGSATISTCELFF